MSKPIYPDKTKTGLAALKPLTDVFFAEPERWVWEELVDHDEWAEVEVCDAVYEVALMRRQVRLTPKPRRVWIGDQSYPEPLSRLPNMNSIVHCADVLIDRVVQFHEMVVDRRILAQGFLFRTSDGAQQCLDAYRKARRVE